MWFVHRDVKRPRESFASHPSMFLLRFTEFQEKVTTVTICQKEEELSTTFQVLHAHKKEFQNLRGMQITSTCRDRRGWEWWWWRRPQMLPPPRQAPKKMLKISNLLKSLSPPRQADTAFHNSCRCKRKPGNRFQSSRFLQGGVGFIYHALLKLKPVSSWILI